MAEFTARDVQALRKATGAGMMDAKRALEETDGDAEAAARQLREQGKTKAAGRDDRANAEGAVAVANTASVAAVVELKSETDFVAKSEEFTALAQALADDVAASGKDAVQDHVATIEDLRISLKENIEVGRIERFEASDGEVLDTYLHRQNDRGVNGVVVHLAGGSSELAHDVALHIASSRPKYLTRDEVPVDEVEQERATLETLSRNEGKPEAALERIVTGRLDGWYRQHTLLEQKFVKDEKRSIAEVLGDVTIKGFAQVEIGAG